MPEEDDRIEVEGLSLDEAVAAVAGVEDEDRDRVRAALAAVSEDGTVSREAVEPTLARLAKVIATPETRLELASIALSDARAAAEPVADLEAVRARLDAFEARLADVDERVARLGADLDSLVDEAGDGDLYAIGAEILRLERAAGDLQRAADELTADVEEFERWVRDPDRRLGDLDEQVDAVAGSLDELAGALDGLADAGPDADADAAAAWADATLRHRVSGLLLADLRAELADLRAWHERGAPDGDGAIDRIEARLDELAGRRAAIRERLDELARPAWRERHGDRIAGLEDALAAFDPPVAWGEVWAELDARRPTPPDDE